MVTDEIYYTKMKSFTLEILHRKKNFHFNGLGMFNLDYTFIFSVCSKSSVIPDGFNEIFFISRLLVLPPLT